MNPSSYSRIFAVIILSFLIQSNSLLAQDQNKIPATQDTLITTARELMEAIPFCALITVDSTGQPHVRTMEPFPPESDMTVWLGTNDQSRKVREIRDNPKVTLYYADCNGNGYVSIMGKATLVDDRQEEAKRWNTSWDEFYKEDRSNYMLIKIIPQKMEVISYEHGIIGNSETWETPSVVFKSENRN